MFVRSFFVLFRAQNQTANGACLTPRKIKRRKLDANLLPSQHNYYARRRKKLSARASCVNTRIMDNGRR